MAVLFDMKYLAVAFGLACTAASAAPLALPPAPAPAVVVDLRQALQQYHRDTSAAPRQLTPVERAELRRQLAEFGQGSVQRGPRR